MSKSIQSLLQSKRSNNARLITRLIAQMHEIKKEIKAAHLSESRKQLAETVFDIRCELVATSAAQKGIKTELLARKLARPHVYKKHGMEDARYLAWKQWRDGVNAVDPNANVAYKPMQSIACQC